MKKLWIGIGLLILSNSMLAATPTMKYSSQPLETAFSLPVSFGVANLAPIPQDLCSPTIMTASETATCSGLPVCKGSPVRTASFSCSVTTSCNHTVPASKAGGACTVSLNVTKPGNLAASTPFTFRLRYGSYNALLDSDAFALNGTNPLPPADAYRTITFKNSCNKNIWFGTITGAAPTKHILTGGSIDCDAGTDPGKQACVAAGGACYSRIGAPDACLSQACSNDNDCVTGASCDSSKAKCFWANPTPANQSFQLTTGQSNTVKIPEYTANRLGVVWSGAFGGRTGCTATACTSALCTTGSENAQGVCSLGVGFQQPATQTEPTFITYPTGITPMSLPDAYDVTTINGANVPMSMYPTNEPIPTAGNPYTCGAAGFNQNVPATGSPTNTIGASSWQLATNQANVAYRYVVSSTATPQRCSTDSNCSTGQICGLNYSSESIGSTTAPGSGFLVCGVFGGWFTADEICGTNNNFTNAINLAGASVENFQCSTPVALGHMSDLYQCSGNYAVSCYASTSTNCCGCVNWSSQGTTVEVPSNTAYVANCQAENPSWTGSCYGIKTEVYDTILYLKRSCPSCYTYPFDDKSSSFTCSNGSTTTTNTEDYTVEFCPGGNGNTGFEPVH
jgi:hypothetical protein